MLRTPVWSSAGPGTVAALDRAAQILRDHGAEVEDVELPSEFNNLPHWHEIIFEVDGSTGFLPEYRTDKDKLAPFLIQHVEGRRSRFSHADELRAFDGVAALRPRMDEILGRYTAVITPSVPDEAPLGQEKTGSPVFNSMWTVRALANLSKLVTLTLWLLDRCCIRRSSISPDFREKVGFQLAFLLSRQGFEIDICSQFAKSWGSYSRSRVVGNAGLSVCDGCPPMRAFWQIKGVITCIAYVSNSPSKPYGLQ